MRHCREHYYTTAPIAFTSCSARKVSGFRVIAHDGIRLIPGRNAINAKRATEIKKHLQNTNDLAQRCHPSAALLWQSVLLEQNTAILKVTSPVFRCKDGQTCSVFPLGLIKPWTHGALCSTSRSYKAVLRDPPPICRNGCSPPPASFVAFGLRMTPGPRWGACFLTGLARAFGGQEFRLVQIMSAMVNVARTLVFFSERPSAPGEIHAENANQGKAGSFLVFTHCVIIF